MLLNTARLQRPAVSRVQAETLPSALFEYKSPQVSNLSCCQAAVTPAGPSAIHVSAGRQHQLHRPHESGSGSHLQSERHPGCGEAGHPSWVRLPWSAVTRSAGTAPCSWSLQELGSILSVLVHDSQSCCDVRGTLPDPQACVHSPSSGGLVPLQSTRIGCEAGRQRFDLQAELVSALWGPLGASCSCRCCCCGDGHRNFQQVLTDGAPLPRRSPCTSDPRARWT